MQKLILALTCVALLGAPAFACLNDREARGVEQQFQASYEETAPVQARSDRHDALAFAGVGLGALLLAGAFWRGGRRSIGR